MIDQEHPRAVPGRYTRHVILRNELIFAAGKSSPENLNLVPGHKRHPSKWAHEVISPVVRGGSLEGPGDAKGAAVATKTRVRLKNMETRKS